MKRMILIACMLAAVTSGALAQDAGPLQGSALQSLTYAGFIEAVKDGAISKIQFDHSGLITGTIVIGDKEHFFTTDRPLKSGEDILLLELLAEKGVEVTHGSETPVPMVLVSIVGCISVAVPLVTIILLLMVLSRVKRIEQFQFDSSR